VTADRCRRAGGRNGSGIVAGIIIVIIVVVVVFAVVVIAIWNAYLSAAASSLTSLRSRGPFS